MLEIFDLPTFLDVVAILDVLFAWFLLLNQHLLSCFEDVFPSRSRSSTLYYIIMVISLPRRADSP